MGSQERPNDESARVADTDPGTRASQDTDRITDGLLSVALAAAATASGLVRERSRDMGRVRTKSTSVDLVTDTDVAAGAEIVREVLSAYPDARFVVEEKEVFEQVDATEGTLEDDGVWVIDPLDGTTSFVHGYPCYSVSVAYLERGVPTVGVVHEVPTDTVFAATRDGGATMDGAPISSGEADSIDSALLMTGFPYDRTRTLARQLAVFSSVMRTAHGVRRDGSAAVDCCRVAAGQADGFWEFGLQPWDLAAGVCILREAGALITDFHGEPWTPDTRHVVAANPELHPKLLDLVASADPGE